MAVDKAKIEEYANKVYRGDLKRFKEKQKKDATYTFNLFFTEESKATKGKRVTPTSSQGKMVINECKRKCVICGKKYDDDPEDFQIHHINGDRSYSVTSNLVLLCHSCHKKIHTIARAKLKDYKEKAKRSSPKKTRSPFDIPSFDMPTYNPPSFDSLLGITSEKKSRKKKGR